MYNQEKQYCLDIFAPKFHVYRKVASSNMSCLEAHAGFFQFADEGDFRSLFTVTF